MTEDILAGAEDFPQWVREAVGNWIIVNASRLTEMKIHPRDCSISFEERRWGGIAIIHSDKGDIPLRVRRPDNPPG